MDQKVNTGTELQDTLDHLVEDILEKEPNTLSFPDRSKVFLSFVSRGLTVGSALSLCKASPQELSTWRRHIPGFLKTEALIRTESSKRCRREAEEILTISSPHVAEKVVNLALESNDPKITLMAADRVLKGAGVGGYASGGALIQADQVNILSSIAFERGSKPRPEDSPELES
jgi:translation initiation factor 2B subunit (eIF-2B alpha/beta/delta family)